jgi:hypothetical protein
VCANDQIQSILAQKVFHRLNSESRPNPPTARRKARLIPGRVRPQQIQNGVHGRQRALELLQALNVRKPLGYPTVNAKDLSPNHRREREIIENVVEDRPQGSAVVHPEAVFAVRFETMNFGDLARLVVPTKEENFLRK